MGKKKDKNIVSTFKKHSYLKTYGIKKLLTFNELFKFDLKFLKFKILLPYINGV
jgi:hypothetical protein